MAAATWVRIPTLKTPDEFRDYVASLGVQLPCDDTILTGNDSPLNQPISTVSLGGKRIANRWAVQPMEGWDGTTAGEVTEEVLRRWRRFGQSGAGVVWGEAMAVRPDGRANPNQLIIREANKAGLAQLREVLSEGYAERYGSKGAQILGFQLTHSGRFCKPNDKFRMEPRVAYRHPLLDRKFGISSDEQVWTDAEIERLILDYIAAAKVAADIGADFVDIKHCHGYLLHEFLSAWSRPGKYGGTFENRTRILREIVSGIRASGNRIDICVRLSAFDFVPFKPDPSTSQAGRPGTGVPEDFSGCVPYRYAFGINPDKPVEYALEETLRFLDLCAGLGVKLLNVSAGSPYYNPHIQRPAAYPPSDGYQPPEDPLIGVARQIEVTRKLKEHAGPRLLVLGTGYSYLQEFLPLVAQAAIRQGWTDIVGIGRMTLSYPTILADAVEKGALVTKSICRTFSDCTTAPRNGMISGCYPLDKYYSAKPEFQKLKQLKRAQGART